ncbi:MAG TPA: winged helix-turn-helix transcriptional regulator [Corynebacterium sp.]|jgi:DNA-binding MarR family transcriptional regulator|uniref:MarR family winged helix-turn-helix transcriptional regulator n=1 Tax=Corynebacterium sp. TaxID=1720 RepID=UPI001844D579|nr:MarR family winged helix-turn-helix transcriptional regulator [Corynebacterium sp.]MDY0113320.1 MarR family winged helix-turn-helix transcriptional regulator [Corynebacterium sp.]HHT31659.1 winged helix-turn-helix transcriptional regulator [Corynebacterium sp.]
MPTKKDTGDRRPAPTMPEAVTSTAAWAIQRLDARLRDAIEGVLAEHAADVALTVRGYWLLEAIGAEPAHSQRELCDLLGIDRSDMVRLVDVLEEAGLVERVRDTSDRRRQLIGPTTAGAGLRESIREGIAEAEARVFAETPSPLRDAVAAALDAEPATEPEPYAEPEPTPSENRAGDGQSGDDSGGRDTAPKKPKKKRKNKKKGGKRQ